MSNQGNFCSTSLGMDCTNARFPANQGAGNAVPFKRIRVEVWRTDTNGNVLGTQPIGTSYTNLTGAYTVSWSYSSTPARVRVDFVYCHQDNRFCVQSETGLQWYNTMHSNVIPIANQDVPLGSWTWSNSNIGNVYDGASRVWEEAFRYSGQLQSVFNAVTIRYPDSSQGPGDAITTGANKTVSMADDCVSMPMNCIAHEFGHMASYLLKPFKFCGIYSSSFAVTSSEKYCTAFEEGLAQFLAQVSFYWFQAPAPRYCISASACGPSGGWSLETSSGSTCPAGSPRDSMITSARYLWDAYDTVNDSYGDSLNWDYFYLVNKISTWASGTANNQHVVDEPWNSALTSVDDDAGRAASDYQFLIDTAAAPSTTQYQNNCSPGGD
ncbi:MAG TPA: hypothetical protein VFS67_03400 [Polyangiaceae bacterium]|nr:hypothetical protein [Polyangiaceae bacterium]